MVSFMLFIYNRKYEAHGGQANLLKVTQLLPEEGRQGSNPGLLNFQFSAFYFHLSGFL